MKSIDKKPLENFDLYLGKFNLLQLLINNDATTSKDIVGFVWGTFLRFDEALHSSFDDRANAIQEIKDLIFLNGNGSERVVKYIHLECEKIRNGFASIEASNNILKPSFGLSDEDLQFYLNNLPDSDKDFYTAYAQAQNIFYTFYKEIIDLCSFEKIQPQQIKVKSEFNKTKYAMYYYYLIKAGIRTQMGYAPGENGKVDALKRIASLHGFTFKSFQIAFNKIDNDHKQNWISGTEQNLKNFKIVIEMLAEYQAAQLLAKNDLNQAELKGDKRGNPVT